MNGAILSVPFDVGASGMQDKTLDGDLHMHVQRIDGENTLLFAAVSVGGTYHAMIPSQEALVRIPLPYWTDYISYLCGEADLHQPRWALSAKLVEPGLTSPWLHSGARQSKDGSFELVVSIKTTEDLPVTMGSIKLKAVDIEEVTSPLLERDSRLFKWLSALQSRNNGLVAQVNSVMHARDQLKQELEELTVAYQEAVREHALIVENLERAFYSLLNAKKDKIWDLLKTSVPQHRLDHLRSVASGSDVRVTQTPQMKFEPDEGLLCNTNSNLRESIYECYDANLPIASTTGKDLENVNKVDIDQYAEMRLMRTDSMSRHPPDGRRYKRTFSELESEGYSDDSRTEEDNNELESEISAKEIDHGNLLEKNEAGMSETKVKRETSQERIGLFSPNTTTNHAVIGEECYGDANVVHSNAPCSARPIRSTEAVAPGTVSTENRRSITDVNAPDVRSSSDANPESLIPGILNVKQEVTSASPPPPSDAMIEVDDATDYESSNSDG